MRVYDRRSGSRWPTPVPAGSIVGVAAGGLHGATNALAPGRPAAAGDLLHGSLSRNARDARSASLTSHVRSKPGATSTPEHVEQGDRAMSVKEPVATAKKQLAAVARPLKRQCLYAVFDTEAEMQQAEQALVAVGVQPQRFSNSRHRSILAHIERAMMRLGDDLVGLQRYAVQAESGHAVLAIAVADRSAAR